MSEDFFEFNPLTEDEVSNFTVLPEGYYLLKVVSAEKMISNAGNPMIKVGFITKENISLTSFLSNVEKMMWKTKHFFDSAGKQDVYATGKVKPSEWIGWKVIADVKIKPPTPFMGTNKHTGEPEEKMGFPKNEIYDFILPEIYEKIKSLKPKESYSNLADANRKARESSEEQLKKEFESVAQTPDDFNDDIPF